MPQLLSLEDWIKAYVGTHPLPAFDANYDSFMIERALLAYLGDFAGTLLTAAVADKLLQEALKPEPEDGKG